MTEPKDDTLEALQEAWRTAQRQLADLRGAVEHASALANAKARRDALAGQWDRALRDLGQAVWTQVKKGKLELPPAVGAQVRAVKEQEKEQAAHQAAIGDLLAEGAEVAGRLKAEKKSAGKVLAPKGKKR